MIQELLKRIEAFEQRHGISKYSPITLPDIIMKDAIERLTLKLANGDTDFYFVWDYGKVDSEANHCVIAGNIQPGASPQEILKGTNLYINGILKQMA